MDTPSGINLPENSYFNKAGNDVISAVNPNVLESLGGGMASLVPDAAKEPFKPLELGHLGKAGEIVGARVEGQELITVAQGALSAEVKAAAAVEVSRKAQAEARTKWLTAGKELGNVVKANLLVAAGRELSDADLQNLEAVAGGASYLLRKRSLLLLIRLEQKRMKLLKKSWREKQEELCPILILRMI